MIILREGFEVVLIVGALLAYVRQVRQRDDAASDPARRRGRCRAAASSAPTFSSRCSAPRAPRRTCIEGVAMLLATGVLFFVSYWLISKAEADKWQRYIQGKVKVRRSPPAAASRSAGAAFLAVYREGVETVLFYQALLASAGSLHVVAAGFAVGLALLGAPLRRFHAPRHEASAATVLPRHQLPALLPGLRLRRERASRELQEAGVFGVTPVGGFPTHRLCSASTPRWRPSPCRAVLLRLPGVRDRRHPAGAAPARSARRGGGAALARGRDPRGALARERRRNRDDRAAGAVRRARRRDRVADDAASSGNGGAKT